MSYSFDVLQKLAFEKEIEKLHPQTNSRHEKHKFSDIDKEVIIDYLEYRIKEIDDQYGDPAVRE